MWGAQLSSPGWTYGIAGGVGFLIGITQGVYETEDREGHDSFSGSCGARREERWGTLL
jgi:hypothetical protein